MYGVASLAGDGGGGFAESARLHASQFDRALSVPPSLLPLPLPIAISSTFNHSHAAPSSLHAEYRSDAPQHQTHIQRCDVTAPLASSMHAAAAVMVAAAASTTNDRTTNDNGAAEVLPTTLSPSRKRKKDAHNTTNKKVKSKLNVTELAAAASSVDEKTLSGADAAGSDDDNGEDITVDAGAQMRAKKELADQFSALLSPLTPKQIKDVEIARRQIYKTALGGVNIVNTDTTFIGILNRARAAFHELDQHQHKLERDIILAIFASEMTRQSTMELFGTSAWTIQRINTRTKDCTDLSSYCTARKRRIQAVQKESGDAKSPPAVAARKRNRICKSTGRPMSQEKDIALTYFDRPEFADSDIMTIYQCYVAEHRDGDNDHTVPLSRAQFYQIAPASRRRQPKAEIETLTCHFCHKANKVKIEEIAEEVKKKRVKRKSKTLTKDKTQNSTKVHSTADESTAQNNDNHNNTAESSADGNVSADHLDAVNITASQILSGVAFGEAVGQSVDDSQHEHDDAEDGGDGGGEANDYVTATRRRFKLQVVPKRHRESNTNNAAQSDVSTLRRAKRSSETTSALDDEKQSRRHRKHKILINDRSAQMSLSGELVDDGIGLSESVDDSALHQHLSMSRAESSVYRVLDDSDLPSSHDHHVHHHHHHLGGDGGVVMHENGDVSALSMIRLVSGLSGDANAVTDGAQQLNMAMSWFNTSR